MGWRVLLLYNLTIIIFFNGIDNKTYNFWCCLFISLDPDYKITTSSNLQLFTLEALFMPVVLGTFSSVDHFGEAKDANYHNLIHLRSAVKNTFWISPLTIF